MASDAPNANRPLLTAADLVTPKPIPELQQPSTVTLIVDPQQQKQLRNTFVFWEVLTFGLGVFVGKKLFEPRVK